MYPERLAHSIAVLGKNLKMNFFKMSFVTGSGAGQSKDLSRRGKKESGRGEE